MQERANKRSLAERMRLVDSMQASGQAHRQWCEEHGINLRTMRDWVRLWRKAAEGKLAPEAVFPGKWLEVTGKEKPSVSGATCSSEISIRIGACTIHVAPGFDREALADVFGMLLRLC